MKQQGNFILFHTREEFKTWLLKQTVKRSIKLIQNHHTWIPNYSNFNGNNHFERLEAMRNSHIKDRKFIDVAQNITTFPDGSIAYSLGRPFEVAPAGIAGQNSNAICIEHLGDFDIGKDKMTDEHRKTIIFINAILCEWLNLTPDTSTIVYHHWFHPENGRKLADNDPTFRKSCPGTNFFGGNKIADAEKHFIPLIKEKLNKIKNGDDSMKYTPKIYKERIVLENGKLKFIPLNTKAQRDVAYKTKATDVRWIKLDKGRFDAKFVYEKNAKVTSLAKKHNSDIAINFPYFDMPTGILTGDARDGNKVLSSAYGKTLKWHSFVSKNGSPLIGKVNIKDSFDFLVQGAPLIVENGVEVWAKSLIDQEIAQNIGRDANGNLVRCQRTFVGLDKEGNFHLFVADGRTSSDQGITVQEAALYAISKGCVTVLCGDGGGSSILFSKSNGTYASTDLTYESGGINQSLNVGNNERIVHHALMFFMKEEIKQPEPPKVEQPKNTDQLPSISRKVKVIANGKETKSDGYLINGLTYLPLREVGEELGAEIGWDGYTYTATIKTEK